ncbi:MAG: DUF2029 domain-containing protein [Anaerolineales bacterium]|nr:DUF2029 domain-containing protein [Anaerolineales bacterium]
MKNHTTFSARSNKFLTHFTPLYWIAVFAAYFLLSRNWAIVRATSTSWEHLFGLFGFCVFCTILYTAYADYRSTSAPSSRRLMMIGIPILICLFMLVNVAEHSQKSWDYVQYETAFRSIVVEDNPYRSTRYLYPPIFAEAMAAVYRAGTWFLPAVGISPEESSLWMFVFYVHQSGLLYAILLAYYLSLQLAEMASLTPFKGMLFVSGLFLFNTPLLRTVIYNQVNFYILVSVLVAILALARRPFLSGVAIAVGGLIKLYPYALIAPLFAIRKWRALIGAAIGSVGMIAVQTNAFRDLLSWKQFGRFYLSFPVERESAWFRNSSVLSFLRNSLDFAGAPSELLTPLFGTITLIILGWIALRFAQREKLYARSLETSSQLPSGNDSYRSIGHLTDFSVLSLLIAPSAWEHHYVIAMPLAIWAFALAGRRAPVHLMIILVLVFVMPVFNIFPFSYLRTAGLILLLVLTSPNRIFH